MSCAATASSWVPFIKKSVVASRAAASLFSTSQPKAEEQPEMAPAQRQAAINELKKPNLLERTAQMIAQSGGKRIRYGCT